jgi:hypothetical protein
MSVLEKGWIYMSNRSVQGIVAMVLIAVAAVLVLWVLVMWMMPSMMGGMMGDGMMGSMSGCMVLCTVGPLLLAGVLVVLAIVLLRRSP